MLPLRSRLTSIPARQIPRQDDSEFCELPRFGRDVNSAAVLLHNYVVRHRKTKAGSFTGWLGGEERVEHLLLHFCRNAGAVVANTNFDAGSEILRGGPQGWLKTRFFVLGLAPGRSIDAVRIKLRKARVISCGNTSIAPASASKSRCRVILNSPFSARAP